MEDLKIENFYFENGFNLNVAFAGNEIKNMRLLQETFGVTLNSRDGKVEISGNTENVNKTKDFFKELSYFYSLRGNNLEQRDFEILCKAFSENRHGNLREIWSEKITVSPKKREILPRSVNQLKYVRAIRECDVVFGIGPAGTGKTYLAMAAAVSSFLKGDVNRIILTRPARESGENLGFLPGSLEEKISPYLRPLYDALYDMMPFEEATALIDRGAIEVAPLAFMRGRTLSNAFIILDEAQNTTSEQMLMFLTRMGFNSRCVITGDPTQADLKRGEKSGLKQAIRTLQDIPEIGFCHFGTADVVRHSLLEKIITRFQEEDEKNKNETSQ